jgi:hypothetical protein
MKKIAGCVFIGILVASMGTMAWAGDNIRVTVSGVAGWPSPNIVLNGNDTTQGTIQLFYNITGYTFPVGDFARFNVDMSSVHLGGANNAVYNNAVLTLTQNGSENLLLLPDLSSFDVTQLGWSGSTEVLIRIPAGVPNTDGTDLVGNLNMSIPGPNHIGTPSTIQVHIRLVYPTSCLKAYNFITDEDFNDIVTLATLNVNTKKDMVTGTSNPGQFSDNILIANTCGQDEVIDLSIILDQRWETNPKDPSKGNAVFTYSANGAMDPDSFNYNLFSNQVSHQQNLCIQNLTIPAGTSLLAAVHSEVIKGQAWSTFGSDPFSFEGEVMQGGGTCSPPLSPDVTPNPISTTLPFVTQ